MSFENLNLIDPIRKALHDEGYHRPTPIQAQAIPVILQGKDILGCAQTGTGKTAAFAIPILQLLHGRKAPINTHRVIQSLILTPTRELAVQIGESFSAYGRHTGLRYAVIYGGVSQNAQTQALRSGVDVLIATPGRLLDLINQGYVHLNHIRLFVLDEADRMLDMGFIHDIRKIVAKLPSEKQTLLFAATMPQEIRGLAQTILNEPEHIAVTPVSSTVDAISQSVYYVQKSDKRSLLKHLLQNDEIESVLIFTRTKHGADKVTRDLNHAGVPAEAIHGNKSQNARQRAMNNFKKKRTRVLVATDIAARGIDVDSLSHVINYELPDEPETYVHRIGRTGRAGLSGTAISFCDTEEQSNLRNIRKLIAKDIPVVDDHPYAFAPTLSMQAPKKLVFSSYSRGRSRFRRK